MDVLIVNSTPAFVTNFLLNPTTTMKSLTFTILVAMVLLLTTCKKDGPSTTLPEATQEGKAVLAEGKKLWQAYFTHTDVKAVREELKLNRADVGWYQVCKALQARNASGDFVPVNFKPFEEAYKTLTEKLQPMVYELGFLKV
jgi:hypothetical protein